MSVTNPPKDMNTSKSLEPILTNIVYPMVGPRCKTLDRHDFPELQEDGRCLVCTTYEEVDRAAAAIVEAVEGLAPMQSEWEEDIHGTPNLDGVARNKLRKELLQAIKEWQ